MPGARGRSAQDPQLVSMPAQKMAMVRSVGDPNVVGKDVFPALYGSAYALKFALKKQGREFKVSPPRARWPNAHVAPKEEWVALWGIPVPEDVESLPQKTPGVEVALEEWQYGTVAQILHIGPYSEEGPAIARLHAFIAEQGYEIAGDHEEEYLSAPTARVQKTIIRYPVRPRAEQR